MRKLKFSLLAIAIAATVSAQSLNGDWTGKLQVAPGVSLKLVLHINSSDNSITMDSPDQGAYGIKAESIYLQNDSVNLKISSLRMSYEGKLTDNKLSGTFQQAGVKLPLSFEKGVAKAVRPQTPQPPFPYKEEEVKIENTEGGSVLAGTLTLPENYSKSTPVVVMVTGSGQQNRDEELFEHKPFAVIADYLARNGIASLRYDDRGAGESTGDIANATTKDYASDAKAVLNWLRQNKRFGKIGIIGHSEGGIIAYMLAADNSTPNEVPDFIVSIAGPSVKGSEILDYQNKVALMANGITEAQAIEYAANARKEIEKDPKMVWMRYFLQYDPTNDLKNLKVPAFIIYGEKDQQVPASLNLQPARTLAPKATIKSYTDLNHLMQHAVTGSVGEYASITETISTEVLADIVAFIKSL